MTMMAKITPSAIPSAMAQAVMITVLTSPVMIAGAVRNWPTTLQAICPSAKALAIQRKTATISAAATQRP